MDRVCEKLYFVIEYVWVVEKEDNANRPMVHASVQVNSLLSVGSW